MYLSTSPENRVMALVQWTDGRAEPIELAVGHPIKRKVGFHHAMQPREVELLTFQERAPSVPGASTGMSTAPGFRPRPPGRLLMDDRRRELGGRPSAARIAKKSTGSGRRTRRGSLPVTAT